jgi:hypothetical protein
LQRASEIEPAQTVTITRKEYDRLLRADDKLGALEAAGVDNWSGYADAMREIYAA